MVPDDALHAALALLRLRLDSDLSSQAPALLRRRLQRRAALQERRDLGAYVQQLHEDDAELQALHRALLVGETRFFRDPPLWQRLVEAMRPLVATARDEARPLRAWVVGCATGQDAYSLAMLLDEHFGDMLPRSEVFATDLDEAGIQHARNGRYDAADVASLDEGQRARWLVRDAAQWRVDGRLRAPMVFARHDATVDAPMRGIDLLVCRNMLMYLGRAARLAAVDRLAYSLRPGGVLFVGRHEGTLLRRSAFQVIDAALWRRSAAPSPPWRVVAPYRGPERRRLVPLGTPRAATDTAIAHDEFVRALEQVHDANLELQRANAELDASRVDLQILNDTLQRDREALRTAYDELHNVLTSTDVALLIVDRDLRVRRFSAALQRLTPIVDADIGRRFTDLALSPPDATLAADVQALLDGAAPPEREPAASADGVHYLRRLAAYRTADGRIDGVVISFTDISARWRHEEALQRLNNELEARVAERTAALQRHTHDLAEQQRLLGAVLHGSPDGIVVVDAGDRVLLVNPAARRMLGVPRPGGARWVDAVGLRDARGEPLEPGDSPTERARAGTAVHEQRLRCGDKLVEVSAVPLHDEHGAVVGAVAHVRDASLRAELEREVARRADDERQQLGRELHDSLGQQLSGIALLACAARERLGADPQASAAALERLEGVVDAAKQQLRAVLKGLAPVELGARGLALALAELIDETHRLHGIECRFVGSAAVAPTDRLVSTQLYMIAREAVHNAVKHAQPRHITVKLEHDHGVRLVVQDDGGGLRSPIGDVGMGLRLMEYRARMIGGTLEVKTAHGGTRVSCMLSGAVR